MNLKEDREDDLKKKGGAPKEDKDREDGSAAMTEAKGAM